MLQAVPYSRLASVHEVPFVEYSSFVTLPSSSLTVPSSLEVRLRYDVSSASYEVTFPSVLVASVIFVTVITGRSLS